MCNYFEFEVGYWSEEENCEKTYCGLTCAEDYTEAAQTIDEWYGFEDISYIKLINWGEDNRVLQINRETFDKIKKEHIF